MHREQIKELALNNGFKLKPQPDGSEDLNPYVYEFAAALTEHMQQQNDYLRALASGQPLYDMEEKIADLMQRNKALREERDQLKAVLQDVNTSDYRFSVEQLSAHDAEVIAMAISDVGIPATTFQNKPEAFTDGFNHAGGLLQDYANQLRQPQPGNDSCELECGAYGTYCRCRAEKAKEVHSGGN